MPTGATDNCRPEMVQAYADGQLGLADMLELERHLKVCARCADASRQQRELSAAIAGAGLYYRAPSSLRRSLQSALTRGEMLPAPAALPPQPRRLWQQVPWRSVALAASAFFVVVLSAGLAFHLNDGGRDEILHDVIQSHVRSLMLNHLTDVPSSDQHTVKPWFNGKLDFSPPVKDLAAEGFPLIGGRVDVIQDRPVAALIYRRRRHYINLFIWPAAHQAAAETSRRGYNVVRWETAGMAYWAVSDLNRAELEEFARLVQSGG